MEIKESLEEPLKEILEAMHGVLEKTPPELAADICDRGIILTGGGALLHGMDKLLQSKLSVPVSVAKDPISCVVIGTGKALNLIEIMEEDDTVVNALKIK